MWEVDHKEAWVSNNLHFWTVALDKIHDCPLDSKEIKAVNPKWNEPWIFTGRTDAEAELQYFGHLMQTADLLAKTLMLGKIESRRRGQQRVRWLDGITIRNGHELGQTLGDGEVHGVAKSQTQLSDWQQQQSYYGKEPACRGRKHKRHGFHPRVREIPWRRAWTEEIRKSHGQRSLAGYSP